MNTMYLGIAFGVALLIAIGLFLTWPLGGRKRGDLAELIRFLLLSKENGGTLQIRHQDSEAGIDFCRESGEGATAVLLLSVPKAWWSQRARDRLHEVFEAQDWDVKLPPEVHRTALAELRFELADIYDEACGAAAARASHLILDALSVPPDAELKPVYDGPNSRRFIDHIRETNSQTDG